MASEQSPEVTGYMTKGGHTSLELKPSEPFLGQQGPSGARFLGWVLVQVWDVPKGCDGCVVQLSSTTGDQQQLMDKAAAKLNQGWPGGR